MLRHVINAAGACRVDDFLLKAAAVGLGHFHLEVALRMVAPRWSHSRRRPWAGAPRGCPDRFQQWPPAVVGAVDVVIDGVALGGAALHRIGAAAVPRRDHGIGRSS